MLHEPQGALFNGGVIGAALAKKAITVTESTGYELAEAINKEIRRKYEQFGINPEQDRAYSFAGYVGHVIATPEKAIVTAVGDIYVAVNGVKVAGVTKKIDIHNEKLRAEYIENTEDVKGGFEHIRQNIIRQYAFQNTSGHEFSYPALDGTSTLREGVEYVAVESPRHILLWSDGYPNLDSGGHFVLDDFSIEGLERKLAQAFAEDPFRCKKYPAVGYLQDDRTAVEVIVDGWEYMEVEAVSAKGLNR